MKTRKLINKKEFEGRNRFSFGLSADGTKILIYGAGYEIGRVRRKNVRVSPQHPLARRYDQQHHRHAWTRSDGSLGVICNQHCGGPLRNAAPPQPWCCNSPQDWTRDRN